MKAIENKNWFKVNEGWVLTNGEAKSKDCAYDTQSEANWSPIIKILGNTNIVTESFGTNRFLKIVGSTFPLEGIPLIVLEDEIVSDTKRVYQYSSNSELKVEMFLEGYTQAKSKYKYTEEDLKFAYNKGMINSYPDQSIMEDKMSLVQVIKFLNQPKEIEFETEIGFTDDRLYYQSNILKIIPHPTHKAGQLIIK